MRPTNNEGFYPSNEENKPLNLTYLNSVLKEGKLNNQGKIDKIDNYLALVGIRFNITKPLESDEKVRKTFDKLQAIGATQVVELICALQGWKITLSDASIPSSKVNKPSTKVKKSNHCNIQ